ncbi:hypothetical protein [Corynebacterium sp.]|uniref:hypothetical protein n=3 Tax=unclassified Corynebacterium TaxID=2624378 RepID=UPI002648DCDD|nr:hypothetical protein [Corynebacterium sp.]MDN5720840.1 hypothetical protein [Corynebacterium sp.]
MTMFRLMLAGHRTVCLGFLTVVTLLTGLAGGVIGTAVRATQVADGYRASDVVTTEVSATWANYQGTATFAFMVSAIACVVGVILLLSVAQFLVSSLAPTSRTLRLLGVSRRLVRLRIAGATFALAVVAVVLGLLLSPVAGLAYRWLLGRIGLVTTELGSLWMPGPTVLAGICLAAWGIVTVWWQGRHLAGIEADARRPGRGRRILRVLATPLRYAVGVGAAMALWALHDATTTMDNFNEMSFGIALCTLLLMWGLAVPVLRVVSWLLRRGGTGRMLIGGVVNDRARRVAGMSLVASLLVVLGGTAALAALTSTIGDANRSAASLQATAVTARDLTEAQSTAAREAGFTVSPLDTDPGWLEGVNSVDQLPVHRVDPVSIGQLSVEGMVLAGSLAEIGGDDVAADERWELGEKILVRDDDGVRREVTVVAVVDRDSALGGGLTVDGTSFPLSVSAVEGEMSERTFVAGAADVNEVVPDVRWLAPQEVVEEQIDSEQQGQMDSLAGMVGGIGLIAVVALVHAVVGFAGDLQGTRTGMRRLSFSRARVSGVLGGIGLVIGLAAGVMSAVSLWAAQFALSEMLVGTGVTTALDVPWSLLLGLWGVVVLAAVAGMLAPRGKTAK